jgi:hypothetical protein
MTETAGRRRGWIIDAGGNTVGTNHTPSPTLTFPHEGDLSNLTVNKNGVGHLNAATGSAVSSSADECLQAWTTLDGAPARPV